MNVDRHYDEETLISFLGASGDPRKRDPHLASCLACAESLDQYRAVVGVLGNQAAWDLRELKEEPVPRTVATLRAFATTMAREDEAAAPMVAELLAGPREWWANRLRHHPEYRTSGVVRKLLEASDRAIDTMPPDAVEITALAVDIAESLAPAAGPSETWAKLRGAAWRDRGYALYYVGRFREALDAVERAEESFRDCVVADYDLARVGIVRGLAERALEMTTEAFRTSRRALDVFERFGAADRAASARSVEASLFAKIGDYHSALALWQQAEKAHDRVEATEARAVLLANVAYAEWHLGQFGDALQHFEFASAIFEELGLATAAARTRWNVANVLLETGQTDEALRRHLLSQREFERLGMTPEAALASLDASEILLDRALFDDVERMCRYALAQFKTSGVAYSVRAMRAIAYLSEAAKQRNATPELVREVRRYVRGLPSQPEAVFLHLPD